MQMSYLRHCESTLYDVVAKIDGNSRNYHEIVSMPYLS
jgi:hypothetical protein